MSKEDSRQNYIETAKSLLPENEMIENLEDKIKKLQN